MKPTGAVRAMPGLAGGVAEHRVLREQARELAVGPRPDEILLVERRDRRLSAMASGSSA